MGYELSWNVPAADGSPSGAASMARCMPPRSRHAVAGIAIGHQVVEPMNTPLCNVWLTLLKGTGVEIDAFGDSTGTVKELVVG